MKRSEMEKKLEELIYCYLGPAIDEYGEFTIIKASKDILKGTESYGMLPPPNTSDHAPWETEDDIRCYYWEPEDEA